MDPRDASASKNIYGNKKESTLLHHKVQGVPKKVLIESSWSLGAQAQFTSG